VVFFRDIAPALILEVMMIHTVDDVEILLSHIWPVSVVVTGYSDVRLMLLLQQNFGGRGGITYAPRGYNLDDDARYAIWSAIHGVQRVHFKTDADAVFFKMVITSS
jgi:hypothetical protein